jgi:replicative DNA helicase
MNLNDIPMDDLEPQGGKLRSEAAETAVLSVLMTYPDAYDGVAEILKPALFTQPGIRALFVLVRREISAGKFPDVVTLAESLNGRMTLPEVHAVSVSHSHTARGIKGMVDLLVERFKSRELHRIANKLSEAAFDTQRPAQERIDYAMSELQKLEESAGSDDDWFPSYEAAIAHLELIEQRETGKSHGIETGLVDLDELLDGGLQRGNLVVIGARPSMGKTALGMTIGLNVAHHNSVAMLSMEMPHSDLRDRQLAILGRIPLSHLKRPKLHDLDHGRVVDAVERSKSLRFFASDKSGLNIMQVRSKARTIRRKRGLDVLVVDYIGLMAGLDPKAPRAYQIEEISRGLKALAKELDIVVICLAQVNRGAMDRVNSTPGLHDLRDSGAIEQDADVVGFIHRPIVANPNAGDAFARYALLRVAKNRQGRTGDINLFYQGECTRFDAWSGGAPSASAAKQQPAKRGFDHDEF